MNTILEESNDATPNECIKDMLSDVWFGATLKYRHAITDMISKFDSAKGFDQEFQVKFENKRRAALLASMACDDLNSGLVEFDEYDVECLANPET